MATTALPLPTSPVKTVAAVDRGRNQRKRPEGEPRRESNSSENAGHQITKVPLNSIEGRGQDGPDSSIKRHATMRVKKMSSTTQDPSTRFPRLNDCAHFHYDQVDLIDVTLTMHKDPDFEAFNTSRPLPECLAPVFTIRVGSKEKCWLIKRSYEDFRVLDKQLHSCIYDRRYSQLVELPKGIPLSQNIVAVRAMLSHYLSRYSQIAGDMINCGPVLNWMEMENHGNHVIANDESAINIPAVAAAHVVKRYTAQAPDEISLDVGDMISVIDMPPLEETSWWRGKKGFDVGFFPSQCVELIGEHLPPAVAERVGKTPKPVLRKQGKLILFLRSFILARPTKRGLKERGILRERVFSCDLGEHLLNSGSDIPLVIKACTEFIEKYGIVDGIYRQSGVASNVQRLRDDFDCDILPDLALYQKDVHCVSSVCKLYFRELPNPLLTYQLYKNFEEAAMSPVQLHLMHDAVQQLPPPHYRTLEFLTRHLAKMAAFSNLTGMNVKNLAIVWAPNLLRSKDIEVGSCAAFLEIKVQATVVEFLIKHVEIIFNDKLLPEGSEAESDSQLRPKSMVLSAPTKLLSLEEARARSATMAEAEEKPKYIEVGGGPSALPKQYHTVIDLPYDRKSLTTKSKKSAVWRALFTKKDGKRKGVALKKGKNSSLRSARSEESLSSTEAHLNKKTEDEADTVVYRRSRSNSMVESVHRTSSHDSFFELDPGVVAAATRDFIESTATAQRAKQQEDRSSSRESSNRGDRSSPQWIDQSISSAESETPSSLPRDSCAFATPIIETDDESEVRHRLRGVAGGAAVASTRPGEIQLHAGGRTSDPVTVAGGIGSAKPRALTLQANSRLTNTADVKRRSEVPRRRNVEVQTPTESSTLGPTGIVFQNGSGSPAVYFNLEDAVLGSATPRKSALFRSPDVLSPSSPRYSLEAVMSEYDQLMESYGTQEQTTPDFLTSSDSLAALSGLLGSFVPTPMDRVAPIASADSTSSAEIIAPIPPPRRESCAASSMTSPNSPSTPTVDPSMSLTVDQSMSPTTPPGGCSRTEDSDSCDSVPGRGSTSTNEVPSISTTVGSYPLDTSEIHLEGVEGGEPRPVPSPRRQLLEDPPLPVTSIDEVMLAPDSPSDEELGSVCSSGLGQLTLEGQSRGTEATATIPVEKSDIREGNSDLSSQGGVRSDTEGVGDEMSEVWGSEVGGLSEELPEHRADDGTPVENVFSRHGMEHAGEDIPQSAGRTTNSLVGAGVGRDTSTSVLGSGEIAIKDTRDGMVDIGSQGEQWERDKLERQIGVPFEQQSRSEAGVVVVEEEGEHAASQDTTPLAEDEGRMHALPGETIIISDIIEL